MSTDLFIKRPVLSIVMSILILLAGAVSLFMLPRESRQDELVTILGHQARIWSAGDRTFVLVANESAPEMERMTALVRTTLR